MKGLILSTLLVSCLLKANDYSNNEENEYKYESSSGTKYKYDLSDPSDWLDYQTDLDAQLDDSINPNPGIELDQGIGEYGGGAEL